MLYEKMTVGIATFLLTVVGVGCLAAWITHIVVCITANTASAVALLLVGIFFPPIGVIHGFSYWLGYGWVAGT